MNAGGTAMANNDVETAMKEYDLAIGLAGDNLEMAFWSALTLATKGNVSQALPIFKKVFSADKNWIEPLKCLPKTGGAARANHNTERTVGSL
jgi:cytochrome c-type biogenesis protein CcmH/NrfG